MNAKQWLNRAKNIDREIDGLILELNETRSRVLNITQTLSGDIVQSTKDPHKFDRLVELENIIDNRVDELVKVKAEIEIGIGKLEDNRYREILRMRYLQAMTFEQIAVGLNYSWRHTCTLHGRALLKMEEIINGKLS